MKIEISAGKIKGMAQTVAGGLETKPTIRWMESVLIKARDGKLTMETVNSLFSIRSCADCDVTEDGEACVPGKLFIDIMSKLPSASSVKIGTDEKKATIKAGGSKTVLALTGENEFPEPEDGEPVLTLLAKPAELMRAMESVQYAISSQDSRIALTGMLFSAGTNQSCVVGLDGYRLGMHKVACEADGESEMVIPKASVAAMLGLLAKTSFEGEVRLVSDGKHLTLDCEGTKLRTVLIAETYIDYKKIVPTQSETTVKVKTKDLSAALDRTMVISNEGKNKLVKMTLSENTLALSSAIESGTSTENVDAELHGEPLSVGFNGIYLKSALQTVEDETMLIKLNTPVAPVVLCGEGDSEYLHLVLPVRIQGEN